MIDCTTRARLGVALTLAAVTMSGCGKTERTEPSAAPAAADKAAAPAEPAAAQANPAAAKVEPTAGRPTTAAAKAQAPAAEDPKPEGEPSAVLKGPGIVAKVWFAPAKPRVGEIFSVCTQLADEQGQPMGVESVKVDATMPSHGHGMMTQPQHRMGNFCWVTEGMKLHMHGPWELSVHTESAGTKLRATANWEQPPEAL